MIAFLMGMTWPDWVGVVGSVLIAGAYFAVSARYLDADRPAFQLLNLLGASLVLLSLYYRPNPGAIVIESLWVLIALWALLRFALQR